jgi:pyridoxine 5-phosphate synthase
MVLLGVNIDHVATVRQARQGVEPDVLAAARAAVAGGADSVTVHLREDRRHIQDLDVSVLRRSLKVRLNLEMAGTGAMVKIAQDVHPASVCLVPEKRQELTTEGGLDVRGQRGRLTRVCREIKSKGIFVSLFVDPDLLQIKAAQAVGADAVEIHTGAISKRGELKKIKEASAMALKLGLKLNAGHGLDYKNVQPVARIRGMNELNIGFSIVSRALFVGLEQAVREMKNLLP